MLDYTRAAFGKIVDDFKKFLFIFGIAAQAVSLLYLIYALFAPQGILVVNIILLILSTAYLIFLCVQGVNAENKPQKKLAKRIYKWSKLLIKLYTLAVALYALNFTIDNTLGLSVILTALQLIGWVLQVLFEVVSLILEKLYDLVITAIKADLEQVKKPVTTVGNFFKKVTGKEIEQPEPPTKTRAFLDELVQTKKQKKEEEKRKQKQEKTPSENTPDEQQAEIAPGEDAQTAICESKTPKQRKFPFFKRK